MRTSTTGLRKGAWAEEEDNLLRKCIEKFGEGKWHQVPQRAGLNRCRKSCRLRWLNYLRPDIKRGDFAIDEVDLIIRLHKLLGNRWSLIAGRLPGRTANDIKNYWNTRLGKKLGDDSKREAGGSSSKNEAPKTTATTIIKPRPRSFSKNLPWLGAEAANAQTNTIRNDQNLGTGSPPKSVSRAKHDMQWLDNLLNDKEMSEGPTQSFSGSGDERIASLWCENIPLGAKEGGNYTQDDDAGQNGFGNLFMNADLWDLLISEP